MVLLLELEDEVGDPLNELRLLQGWLMVYSYCLIIKIIVRETKQITELI
jgi:hypothetical protein